MNHEHKFESKDNRHEAGYFKQDGGSNMFGKTYDHSIVYDMLFCECGQSKEVMLKDHRKLPNPTP